MKRFLFLLALAPLFLLACKPQPAQQFNKEGITFMVPEGWHISKEKNLSNMGYYLSCEKKGITASGLFVISMIKDSVDATDMLQDCMKDLRDNFRKKGGTLHAGKLESGTFGRYPALKHAYTVSIANTPHSGQVWTFHTAGKTVLAMMQEADEDAEDNKAGFNLITKSFLCR